MWSTASILDAAVLKIYRNKQGEYAALRHSGGDFTQEVKPYSFKRMKVFIDERGRVTPQEATNIEVLVFHKNDLNEYRHSLESILRKKLGTY